MSFVNFYKFLLVEELALEDDITQIHYGKCSIIGFLSSPEYISSLTIPKIDEEYQIPDCAVSLRLLIDFHPKEYLLKTVNVLGTVRLYDTQSKISAANLESAYRIQHKIEELENISDEGKYETIHALKGKYKPIIQVDNIKLSPDARELIVENLFYRQIRQRQTAGKM